MNRKVQQGVVLIEALLGILIFSIGILAMIGMQAVAVKNTIDAQYRTEASFLANEIVGTMWVNNAAPSSFDTTTGGTNAARTAWVARVASMMPSGSGTIAVSGNTATITVSWTLPGETARSHLLVADINPR